MKLNQQNIKEFISELSNLELMYFFSYKYPSLIDKHKLYIDKEFTLRKIDKNYSIPKERIVNSEKKHCSRCGSSKAYIYKKDLDHHDPDSLPKGSIFKIIFKGYKHLNYFECKICSLIYE